MFDTVNTYTETLGEHEERILLLEKSDKEKVEAIGTLIQKFTDISNDFTRVENSILKSAKQLKFSAAFKECMLLLN